MTLPASSPSNFLAQRDEMRFGAITLIVGVFFLL